MEIGLVVNLIIIHFTLLLQYFEETNSRDKLDNKSSYFHPKRRIISIKIIFIKIKIPDCHFSLCKSIVLY